VASWILPLGGSLRKERCVARVSCFNIDRTSEFVAGIGDWRSREDVGREIPSSRTSGAGIGPPACSGSLGLHSCGQNLLSVLIIVKFCCVDCAPGKQRTRLISAGDHTPGVRQKPLRPRSNPSRTARARSRGKRRSLGEPKTACFGGPGRAGEDARPARVFRDLLHGFAFRKDNRHSPALAVARRDNRRPSSTHRDLITATVGVLPGSSFDLAPTLALKSM